MKKMVFGCTINTIFHESVNENYIDFDDAKNTEEIRNKIIEIIDDFLLDFCLNDHLTIFISPKYKFSDSDYELCDKDI